MAVPPFGVNRPAERRTADGPIPSDEAVIEACPMEHPGSERWTVVPHRGSVIAHLEEVPALVEWEPLLDEVRRYATNARVIVLDGPGWYEPMGRTMERALRQTLEGDGVRVTLAIASGQEV